MVAADALPGVADKVNPTAADSAKAPLHVLSFIFRSMVEQDMYRIAPQVRTPMT
jgi:hypothetical protein